MRYNIDGTGAIGIVLGIIGIGYGVYQAYKAGETAKKLDMSIEDLSNKTPVDIQQSIVDRATERAIEREVRIAVNETAKAVRSDAQDEIKREVSKAVNAVYDDLSKDVADRISDDVANIDEYALKEKVTKEAEKKMLKKFDGELDGLLGLFQHNLRTVGKIHDNIESALTGRKDDDESGFSFKLVRG